MKVAPVLVVLALVLDVEVQIDCYALQQLRQYRPNGHALLRVSDDRQRIENELPACGILIEDKPSQVHQDECGQLIRRDGRVFDCVAVRNRGLVDHVREVDLLCVNVD